MQCFYNQGCNNAPTDACCNQALCKVHFLEHISDGKQHTSSPLYQPLSPADTEVLDMGLCILCQSRQVQLHLLLKKREEGPFGENLQAYNQQAASKLKMHILNSERTFAALKTIQTKGLPVIPIDKVTERFLEARTAPEGAWKDAFALSLADLGFPSTFSAAALYRRCLAKVEAGEVTNELKEDILRTLKTQRVLKMPDIEVALTEVLLATALVRQGQLSEAELQALNALSHCGDDGAIRAQAYLVLGSVSHKVKNQENAIERFRQALSVQLRLNQFDPRIVKIYTNLGIAYEGTQYYKKAEHQYEAARQVIRTRNPDHSCEIASLTAHIARMKLRQNQLKEAKRLYLEAMEDLERSEQVTELKSAYLGLKYIYTQKRDFERQLVWAEKIWNLLEEQNADDEEKATLLRSIIKLYKRKKDTEKTEEYQRKLILVGGDDPFGVVINRKGSY